MRQGSSVAQGESGSAAERKPGTSGGGLPRFSRRTRWLALLVLVALMLNYWLANRVATNPPVRVPYSPFFLDAVRGGEVKSIVSRGSTLEGKLSHPVRFAPAGGKARNVVRFRTEIPSFADTKALSQLLVSHDVVINAQPLTKGLSWWQSLVYGFGPTLLLIMLMVWLLRRAGSGGFSGLGRSKARRFEPSSQTVTFADVAGIDEAKAELAEIVDFLRKPQKYARLGGRIPRGVLLSGPPGTGKTLLARAVAGEAGVPFFSLSASEFVEMVVGVGAARVRDLFSQAKAAAPAIVFIDELDAIGRARSSSGGFGGGNDEREQTLNQILTEMDGFDPSAGVIVLASTNRPDILDSALLRAGRFDRRIPVQAPDRQGRKLILQVHTRGVPLADDVDLDRLAGQTPGMVGADLANLVNEAALLAARHERSVVTAEDMSDALERIVLGAERKMMLSEDDRRQTAYHEAGHAIVGMLTEGADPVRKVTIIPRGMALGVTFASPDADRFSYPRHYLLARIKVALGGRAAEELAFGELSTGAESDIQQLTQIARFMVGRWGMSDAIGPIAVLQQDGQSALMPGVAGTSDDTQRLVDEEVRRLVDSAYDDVLELLTENRDRLDSLANALLDEETLDEADAYAAAGLPPPPSPAEQEPALPAT
jgi:cell division protease FtsH